MFEEISALREEAAAKGVATVIWSYPRGEDLSKAGETAIDVGAYAAQIAALLGAHIIKIKLSTDNLEQGEARKVYEKHKIDVSTQAARGAALHAGGVRRPSDRGVLRWRLQGRGRGSTRTHWRSATAVAMARSSAAIPSNGRGRMLSAMLNRLVEIYKGRD